MNQGLAGPAAYYHPEREGAAKYSILGRGFARADRTQQPDMLSPRALRTERTPEELPTRTETATQRAA